MVIIYYSNLSSYLIEKLVFNFYYEQKKFILTTILHQKQNLHMIQ